MNRIVPVAVKPMPRETDGGELCVGDGDAAGILAAIEFRPDAQTRSTVGRSNQTDNRGEIDERRAAPIHRDVGEQAVLNLVPFAGARREVTHRDGEPGALGELLQFPLPEPQACAVASARVRGDQERLRLAIGGAPHLLPPPANRLHGEGRGVVIDPHADPPFVAVQSRRRRREWLCRPSGVLMRKSWTRTRCGVWVGRHVRPAFLKSPTNSFFFVSTEIVGLVLLLRRAHAARDVPKLRVPVDMLASLARLDVALQAIAQTLEQFGDQGVTHVMAQPLERRRQRARAQARPAQGRVRIAGRRRFDQRVQIPQQRRIEIGGPLAASARLPRARAGQRVTRREFPQAPLNGRRRDPRGLRHWRDAAIPIAWASVAAHTRRDRSVKTGDKAACFARSVARSTGERYHAVISQYKRLMSDKPLAALQRVYAAAYPLLPDSAAAL